MDCRKICIIGEFAVGKTSLVRRFVHNQFDARYQTSIGVKVDTKELLLPNGCGLKLAVWDIAGTRVPTDLLLRHMRGAAGYLLVADSTRAETLDCCADLQAAVEYHIATLPFVLMVNKSDVKAEQEISDAELTTLTPPGGEWLRTSALDGENVELAFAHLAGRILEGV